MIDVPDQGTKEWLDFRRTRITATDIPTIMGENPYKTPYRLWQEKKSLVGVFVTHQMEEGLVLEPMIREQYSIKIGCHILPVKKPVIHPDCDYFMASLDGMSFDLTIGCEIKSANLIDHQEAKNDRVPSKYYGQVQWQMFCTQMDNWDYVSYGKLDGDICIVKVSKDEEYLAKAQEKAHEFKMMLDKNIAPDHKIYENELTSSQQTFANRLREAIENRIFWEKEEFIMKQKAPEVFQEKEIESCGIRFEKTSRKGTIDYDNIPELKNVNLEKYRKPNSESWKITLR